MIAGGFEICAFGYCTGPEIIYDEVLAPVGRDVRDGAVFFGQAMKEYYWDGFLEENPANALLLVPVVNLAALTVGGMSGCGGEPARPVPQDTTPAPTPTPPPPPPPAFPQAYAQTSTDIQRAQFFTDANKYYTYKTTNDPTYSYYTDTNQLLPCLSSDQGIFDMLCFGVYDGQIPTTDGASESCSDWLAIGGNEMTNCGNTFMHMVNGMPDFRTPTVAFVAKLFAFGLPQQGLPAFENVSSELLEATSAFGASVRLAALNKDASVWTKFQPELITELAAFFNERSLACYPTDNNERALFDRFKMINAEFKYKEAPVTMTTPWEAVASTSTSSADWMTNLLYAGSVSQMMMSFADERVTGALAEIAARRWFVKTVKENNVDVKYIYFGPVNKSDTVKMKLVDYLNTGIWATYNIPKDVFLNKALAAYRVAYARADGRLPNIDDPTVAACINALDVTTIATWSAPTLVAWQLLQLMGAYGTRVSGQFQGTRGSGGGGTVTPACPEGQHSHAGMGCHPTGQQHGGGTTPPPAACQPTFTEIQSCSGDMTCAVNKCRQRTGS